VRLTAPFDSSILDTTKAKGCRGTDQAGGLNKTPARSGGQGITVTVHTVQTEFVHTGGY